MKLYNFTRLIKKYSCDFSVITSTEGKYKGGLWIPGETVTTCLRGAIVSLPEKKLYQPGGNYTTNDRQLYMFERIPQALKDGKVLYKGAYYSIEEETEYSEFCDAFIYLLRSVSVNDKS